MYRIDLARLVGTIVIVCLIVAVIYFLTKKSK